MWAKVHALAIRQFQPDTASQTRTRRIECFNRACRESAFERQRFAALEDVRAGRWRVTTDEKPQRPPDSSARMGARRVPPPSRARHPP
jgi:hypothetical protein